MTSEWTYAQALAAKIEQARAELRLSQRGLGKRMKALGFGWRQQVVAAVESGERRLLAEELLGLALALETTIQDLLSLSEGDWEKPVALPSGETVSPDFVTSLAWGMDRKAVRWIQDEPEFGPEAKRTPDYSLKFVDAWRTASASRPVEIEFRDAGGSAVTFKMPGITPSDPSKWALTQPQQGER